MQAEQPALTVPKIDGIYEELRTLHLSKHVHAIGVLLRVFLEMSVDDYMARHHLPTTFIEPKSKRKIDKNLKTKVKDTVAHMVANGSVQKDLEGRHQRDDGCQSPIRDRYPPCLYSQQIFHPC